MKDIDDKFLKNRDKTIPLREELRPRTVTTPDGQEITIEPLKDYF